MTFSMFLITADLRTPGQNYDALYDAIACLPGAFRYQQSSWFAYFDGDVVGLRNHLGNFVDSNDSIMVARIVNAAWFDTNLMDHMIANGYPVIAA